jgi:hypothetical protein
MCVNGGFAEHFGPGPSPALKLPGYRAMRLPGLPGLPPAWGIKVNPGWNMRYCTIWACLPLASSPGLPNLHSMSSQTKQLRVPALCRTPATSCLCAFTHSVPSTWYTLHPRSAWLIPLRLTSSGVGWGVGGAEPSALAAPRSHLPKAFA